jgi:hypothetical protein
MMWRLLPLACATACLGLVFAAPAVAVAPGGTQQLRFSGSFAPGTVGTGTVSSGQVPPHEPNGKQLRHVQAAGVPTTSPTALSSVQLPGFASFNGLSHFDQATAGTGIYAGTQFELEPPDQALCVGNGHVVEAVNNAVRVFSTAGAPETAPVALNQFFGLAPEFQAGASATFGDFISDPKCYFDPDTNRFFLTELQISLDPATGDFEAPSHLLVAVTQTADPTGRWSIFELDTTNDGTNGTPTDPGCPCFGDQPLIGADANGFYITTNEYQLAGFAFNGARIYAFSKSGLEHGTNTTAVQFFAGPLTTSVPNGGLAVTIQPATTPNGAYATANNGTEYLMSPTDWGVGPALGTRADRLVVWALTGTATLNSPSPAPSLTFTVIPSEVYAQPPNAAQPPGPRPLGDALHDPLELLATNDDRLNQVVFAAGRLWSGINTAVKLPTGATLSGIAWFAVTPSDPAGTLSAAVARQGYVALSGENAMFPSIGVTGAGRAVMTFSVSGPDRFPSAAYAPLSLTSGAGAVRIAGAGTRPDDGFSGYKEFGGVGVGRWGDYSAAVADTAGRVWMAAEYLPDGPRTTFANWGTFVARVTP